MRKHDYGQPFVDVEGPHRPGDGSRHGGDEGDQAGGEKGEGERSREGSGDQGRNKRRHGQSGV